MARSFEAIICESDCTVLNWILYGASAWGYSSSRIGSGTRGEWVWSLRHAQPDGYAYGVAPTPMRVLLLHLLCVDAFAFVNASIANASIANASIANASNETDAVANASNETDDAYRQRA